MEFMLQNKILETMQTLGKADVSLMIVLKVYMYERALFDFHISKCVYFYGVQSYNKCARILLMSSILKLIPL